MTAITDRILTTHTGSLPRPPELVDLMFQQEEGKPVDPATMANAQEQAVTDNVHRLSEARVDILSDGEPSKASFLTYITTRLNGFSGQAPPWTLQDLAAFPELLIEQYGGPAGAHIIVKNCTGAITYEGHAAARTDVARLTRALTGADAVAGFLPAASPGAVALSFPNQHYDTYERYLFALAAALRHEYRLITDAGLMLQIDCPDLPMAMHTNSWSDVVARLGYQQYLELHIAALNEAVQGLPQDRIRVHICWGNYTGPHQMDVPLTDVLPAVLQASPVGLSWEAANPRHEHEWQDLSTMAIPDDKVLIPGVIDVKTNVVEHPRLVAQRIERFAAVVGRERVIAGTDCGFATFVGFGAVHPSVAWLKLQALADGARLATKHLW